MTLPELKDFRERLIMADQCDVFPSDVCMYSDKSCYGTFAGECKYRIKFGKKYITFQQMHNWIIIGKGTLADIYTASLANIDRMIAEAERA